MVCKTISELGNPVLVWNKQEQLSFCDPISKMNGGGLDSRVVRPFLSHTQIPCAVIIVWGAKGAQRMAEVGAEMEISLPDSGLIQKK